MIKSTLNDAGAKMKKWRMAAILAMGAVLALGAAPAMADSKEKAEIRLLEAAQIIKKIMSEEGGGIPPILLKRAKAVGIFPGMIKGGFILGASAGWGVIIARLPDGRWSAPAFYEMGGGSIGLQIGAQSVDLILVFPTQQGLQGVLQNNVRLGANMSVAAGPVGRDAGAALTGASVRADVYSYSRTKGVFAGVSLEGVGMALDVSTTRNFYGQAYTAQQLLSGKVPVPAEAKRLIDTLDHYTK